MNIQIILNGGMKTCCKTYSTDYIRKAVQSWLTEADSLEVIDIKETNYELEELASYAKTFFEDNLFPLVYVDGSLVAIGQIPDRGALYEIGGILGEYHITKDAIYKAAVENGLVVAQA